MRRKPSNSPEKIRSQTIRSVRALFPVLRERTLAFAGLTVNAPAITKLFGLQEGEYLSLAIQQNTIELKGLLGEMERRTKLYLIFFPQGYGAIRANLLKRGFVENVDFADGSLLLTAEETGQHLSGRKVLLDEMHP